MFKKGDIVYYVKRLQEEDWEERTMTFYEDSELLIGERLEVREYNVPCDAILFCNKTIWVPSVSRCFSKDKEYAKNVLINLEIAKLKEILDDETIVIKLSSVEEKQMYIKLQHEFYGDDRFNNSDYTFTEAGITSYPYAYVDKQGLLYPGRFGFNGRNKDRKIISFKDIIKPLIDLKNGKEI